MHPPVEDAVLQNNPEFAVLYNTLTTAVLNPNGSTKNDPARKEREAVKEELKKHRLKTIKHHLLISALSTANPSSTTAKPSLRRPRGAPQPPPSSTTNLPPELLDLLLLLPPFLTTPSPLDSSSLSLLLSNPPISTLPTLLPSLTPLISASLISSAASLSRLLNPTTNPSFIHRTIPSLPTTTCNLLTTLSTQKQALTTARAATATALTTLLALHATALHLLIRPLESKHGNAARNLELRAVEISLSSLHQQHSANVLLNSTRKEIYTPQATAALRNYAAHLRDARGRVKEEIRGLRAQLGGYGVVVGVDDGEEDGQDEGKGQGDEGRERMLREMARVYRDMGRQVEEVRGDLERLGRA
ncbi:hypothetical protein CONLIGDRAFT_453910 [Coniochaeta ligniaria NRRL 30616]|uniref:Uncharacterized protein n=1 Tax=Coniochaeta ligniaria NRRL 30616 TaxID=1408157 RepID=A0A1J7JDX3_9PEZI|nr:hypothetical protein CONLIGDRAFT_453910 [Coniochaeta ligniaria NRRL 30616]